jgi:hypothetical protein
VASAAVRLFLSTRRSHTPNGEMDLKEIEDDQEWHFQIEADVNWLVDLRFLQSAADTPGTYR